MTIRNITVIVDVNGDVTVQPTQVHVTPQDELRWIFDGGELEVGPGKADGEPDLFAATKKGPEGHAKALMASGTRNATYHYPVHCEHGGKQFDLKNCPEIIIQ